MTYSLTFMTYQIRSYFVQFILRLAYTTAPVAAITTTRIIAIFIPASAVFGEVAAAFVSATEATNTGERDVNFAYTTPSATFVTGTFSHTPAEVRWATTTVSPALIPATEIAIGLDQSVAVSS